MDERGSLALGGRPRASLLAVLFALTIAIAALVVAPARASVPYREVTEPPAGQPVKGTMLVLHGGGWIGGQKAVYYARPEAQRFASLGWEVWNVDFASGAAGLDDIDIWYRVLDASTNRPVCVYGGSSGGNYALLLASIDQVPCVISEAGPTYLPGLPVWLITGYAEPAFGQDLPLYSPLRCAINEPTVFRGTQFLIGQGKNDQLVPPAQSSAFAALLPGQAELHLLDAGTAWFVHSYVDSSELAEYRSAESQFLDHVAATVPPDGDAGTAPKISTVSAANRLRSICNGSGGPFLLPRLRTFLAR